MNVGIIGAGRIAIKMAETLNQLPGFVNYAIASRDLKKAEDFKNQYGCSKAYGSYEALLKDPNVDLIYIATPHALHYEQMKQCIDHQKPVLCEKAFCVTYQEAKDLLQYAKEKNVFVAEALWTSYMPSRKRINELLFDQKVIGNLTHVQAVFQADVMYKERLSSLKLGGGALLDLGVYPISMVLRTLGYQFQSFKVNDIQYHSSGVDLRETVTFHYPTVEACCISDAAHERNSYIEFYGEKGIMRVEALQCPTSITIFDQNKKILEQIDCTPSFGGFEYELYEVKEALEKKQIEPASWTHQDILQLMKILDAILYGKGKK